MRIVYDSDHPSSYTQFDSPLSKSNDSFIALSSITNSQSSIIHIETERKTSTVGNSNAFLELKSNSIRYNNNKVSSVVWKLCTKQDDKHGYCNLCPEGEVCYI